MYKNAPFWFAGIVVLVVLGFWPSYFSPSAPEATFGQHFHTVMMLGWMLMLITQSWLIRTRRRNIHRMIGRFSLVWAPLVVFSALYVVLDHLAGLPQPFPPIGLSFFWLGLASTVFYAILYCLAILNRKEVQLHARYMSATVLAFITPGLGRLFGRLGESTGFSFFSFQTALWVPTIAGVVIIALEARKGGIRKPWVLATLMWTAIVLGFSFIPRFEWFREFAGWYIGFA